MFPIKNFRFVCVCQVPILQKNDYWVHLAWSKCRFFCMLGKQYSIMMFAPSTKQFFNVFFNFFCPFYNARILCRYQFTNTPPRCTVSKCAFSENRITLILRWMRVHLPILEWPETGVIKQTWRHVILSISVSEVNSIPPIQAKCWTNSVGHLYQSLLWDSYQRQKGEGIFVTREIAGLCVECLWLIPEGTNLITLNHWHATDFHFA